MTPEKGRVIKFALAVVFLIGICICAWAFYPEFVFKDRYKEMLDLKEKLYEKFGGLYEVYLLCFSYLVLCFLGLEKTLLGYAYEKMLEFNTWFAEYFGLSLNDILMDETDIKEDWVHEITNFFFWNIINSFWIWEHMFFLYVLYRVLKWYVVEGIWVFKYYRRRNRKSGPKNRKDSVIPLALIDFDSPLEIFEVTTFDVLGFELNETYAFTFFSILSAFTIGNLVVGESTIDEEEDEDFEDEDFTMDATDSLITDNLGDNDDEELDTIIQTIFQSVLFSNLANLIPFGDSNSNYLIFTLYLAGTCFLALNFNGFLIHTFGMIQLFLPQGVPSFLRPLLFVIEFISYFARLFSLGIRLFANMLSGHILMAILSTFAVILLVGLNFGSFASIILLIIITCIFFLETIISYLQAYVFGMLVTIYYGDALNLHH